MEKHKESKDTPKETNSGNAGTAKEKATFDQNGKGASEKFGEAGSTPNESGKENGPGTAKEK
ncbi:hypothetical protein ACJVDH_11485 [Pedobacter sp. AW1-32]|uniref:hypothetical protein n=1 Tax=Pedobacter sp. AW1-32 TaxID=3383026 RepID=UPI003FF068E3